MSTKKKLILIISVLTLTILCSIFAIVSVFAAQSASINSGVNVIYKVPKDLKGSVSFNYVIYYGVPRIYESSSGVETIRSFDESTTTLSNISKKTLTLSNIDDEIRLKFTFKNSSETGAYIAKLTPPPNIANLTFSHSYSSYTDIEDFSQYQFTLNAGGTVTYEAKYTISNVGYGASLRGNFVWTLTSI